MRPTSPSSVAENSSVWRSRGVILTIRSTTGLKPMSSMRSASSRTSSSIWSSATARRSIRSSSRPGVATSTCELPGLLGLVVDADAAVDGGDLQPAGVHDAGQLVDDLRGQLARRREHEGRRPGAVGVDDVGHRHAEGERLARAGGRLDEHVVAVEHVGDDHRLDGERRLDAALGQRAGHGLGHAEIGEGGRHWGAPSRGRIGEAAFCGGEIRLTPTAPSERLQGQEPHGRQDAVRTHNVAAHVREP